MCAQLLLARHGANGVDVGALVDVLAALLLGAPAAVLAQDVVASGVALGDGGRIGGCGAGGVAGSGSLVRVRVGSVGEGAASWVAARPSVPSDFTDGGTISEEAPRRPRREHSSQETARCYGKDRARQEQG
jgi:hypothetical protein